MNITKKTNRRGFTLIEMMVSLVASLILIAGLYQIYLKAENRQSEERRVSATSNNLRRLKESLMSQISNVFPSIEASKWGLVMVQNSPVNYNAPAGNKFSYTSVSPDVISVVVPASNGFYKLSSNFDPESTTVTLDIGKDDPKFAAEDIIMITDTNTMLFYQITKDTSANYSGLTATYDITPYADADPLLDITSYQYSATSGTVTNDLANTANIKQVAGIVRKVNIFRIFAAPDSSDGQLYLYQQVDYNSSKKPWQRLGGPLLNFDVKAVLTSDFNNPQDQVVDMATAKDVSHLLVNFEGGTKENKLFASATISLRGTKGGNIDTAMAGIGATPSQAYGAGKKSGPAILVQNGESFAVIRALLAPVAGQPGYVDGELKFTKSTGEDFTPVGNKTVTPATSIYKTVNGTILVTLMRAYNTATGGWDAHLMEILPDDNPGSPTYGQITQTSVLHDHILSSPDMRSPTAVVSGLDDSDPNNPMETLIIASADTPGKPEAITGIAPSASRLLEFYYRPLSDKGGNYTLAASYSLDTKPGNSNVITGMAVNRVSDSIWGVTVTTSEAISPTTGAKIPGALLVFPVYPKNLVPMSQGATSIGGHYALGTRKIANLYGNVGGYAEMPTTDNDTVSAYVLDGSNMSYWISSTAYNTVIQKYLTTGHVPIDIKTYVEKDGTIYCGTTLTQEHLSQQYIQSTGNTSYTIQAPLVKSATGFSNDGSGEKKPYVDTGIPTNQQSVIYSPTVTQTLAATVLTSIIPNSVANRAVIRVVSNTQSVFSNLDANTQMFLPLLPTENVTNPCTYPPLPTISDDGNGIDAMSLMAMSGSLAPASTAQLSNAAYAAKDSTAAGHTPTQYYLGTNNLLTESINALSFGGLAGKGGGGTVGGGTLGGGSGGLGH